MLEKPLGVEGDGGNVMQGCRRQGYSGKVNEDDEGFKEGLINPQMDMAISELLISIP
jgi:hypothetical protein